MVNYIWSIYIYNGILWDIIQGYIWDFMEYNMVYMVYIYNGILWDIMGYVANYICFFLRSMDIMGYWILKETRVYVVTI